MAYSVQTLGHNILSVLIEDDGVFPNNGALPLILYTKIPIETSLAPEAIERLFAENRWIPSWRNGVYPFHHYHSTAHEMLGCYAGWAQVLFGGNDGYVAEISAGAGVLIPAGISHKRLSSGDSFGVAAAYLEDQSPDMCYGRVGERPEADRRIAALDKPQSDPVLGSTGPAVTLW